MLALLLKLTLAPALVAAATKVAGRLGHRAGGLVGGLPVVAAPIVLIFAVEQGNAFAQAAAAACVLGLVSQVLFCLAYAACATRTGYAIALAAGWLAFGLATALLSAVHPPPALNVAFALLAIGGGSWLLARAAAASPPNAAASAATSDLLLWRLAVTAVLVVALTAAAKGLSPHLAGLLTPFPIITAVLAGFTHARTGAGAAIEMLSGLVPALVCFLAFFAMLAATLAQLGAPAAFALATVSALTLWAALVALTRRAR